MKKTICLIIISLILLLGTTSFGAIEIVPSKNGTGKDQIVNTTVSNSYLLCRGMKNYGERLYGSTVDPHLATNKDWGAVSYLSNSIYGTNTQGGNTGIEVTINDLTYYSTTTNITGVMNWGSNPNVTRYTQTAGLINSYDDSTSAAREYVNELYANRETKYVDYINPKDSKMTLGMAAQETSKLFVTDSFNVNTRNEYPGSARIGLFDGGFGPYNSGGHSLTVSNVARGGPYSYVTFRPVIWN